MKKQLKKLKKDRKKLNKLIEQHKFIVRKNISYEIIKQRYNNSILYKAIDKKIKKNNLMLYDINTDMIILLYS